MNPYILFHLTCPLGPWPMVWAVSLLSMRLISHRLTPCQHLFGIHGLITFSKLMQPPQVFSALPPIDSTEASPKAISGRTSYLRVRLEFHRYPHVIPTFFNRYGFGPPCPFTDTSTCTWIGHPVSGLQHATFAGYDSVSLRLRCSSTLTSLHTITRWPVLQKVRGHFRSLRL